MHHQNNSVAFVRAHGDKNCVKNKRSEHDTAKRKLSTLVSKGVRRGSD